MRLFTAVHLDYVYNEQYNTWFECNLKQTNNVCTHDHRFPLKVDVVDAHHLVGRKGNNTTTSQIWTTKISSF